MFSAGPRDATIEEMFGEAFSAWQPEAVVYRDKCFLRDPCCYVASESSQVLRGVCEK